MPVVDHFTFLLHFEPKERIEVNYIVGYILTMDVLGDTFMSLKNISYILKTYPYGGNPFISPGL